MCKSQHTLQFSDLQFSAKCCTLSFKSFKHHKGKPVTISLSAQRSSTCPVKWLKKFCRLRGNAPGPLFCLSSRKSVSYSAFYKVFKSTLNMCNIPGKFTPHSFRIGAATHFAMLGYPDQVIQRLGRWRSSAWISYVRRNNVLVPIL